MHKVQVGCADSNSRFVMTRAAVQSQASSKVARMNTGRVRRRRQIDDKCLDLRTGIVRSTGRAQVGALPPSPGLAFRPRRRFSRRFATGRAKSCPRPYLRPPQLHGHGKRPWNTVGDRLWERGQGLFTTMPAKQSARLLPPPHNQGRGGRRRDHRGQGRCWHWHHCRQPHWVTEGTMLWGSRQGTARREVSFPKESV